MATYNNITKTLHFAVNLYDSNVDGFVSRGNCGHSSVSMGCGYEYWCHIHTKSLIAMHTKENTKGNTPMEAYS